ncbi:DUF4166 domain-containing protein [Pelomonas sp. HMWF004]|nr:DUF4166 domain-containing protein [Pelomonas sp. HMWF004]
MSASGSMYARAMGGAFEALPAAVQRFHRLQGAWSLHGQVQTDAPASFGAWLLAWGLGSPRRATAGPIHFELQAGPTTETWTRHFPGLTMRSTLRLVGQDVHEALGASRLRFELLGTPQGLEMRLTGLRFLGLPCPRWLLPEVVARETGAGGRLHFEVAARLPGLGLVAGYRGHLDLPEEGAA